MPKRPLDQEVSKARREADRAAAKAAEAQRKLDILLKAQSELIGALVEEHTLHPEKDRSKIISNMQASAEGKSRSTKISAGRATIESASRDAAVAIDLSDGDIAEITGASRQAVQKWHTGKMAIPRRHAEKLRDRKPKGIPMGSWKRIAD